MLTGAKRQWDGRQHVAAFKACGFDPVAEQQRSDGNATFARYREGRIIHRSSPA